MADQSIKFANGAIVVVQIGEFCGYHKEKQRDEGNLALEFLGICVSR